MKWLGTQIDADEARRRIERRWWHRLWGGATPKPGALPRLELVRLPYFLVKAEVTLRGQSRAVAVLVEGQSGAFSIVEEAALVCEPRADGPLLPARRSPSEAADIARDALVSSLIRSRASRGRLPTVRNVHAVDVVAYPYWVYYYPRGRGHLDIKVIDALTGDRPGPKVKDSLLSAFVAARTSPPDATPRPAGAPSFAVASRRMAD